MVSIVVTAHLNKSLESFLFELGYSGGVVRLSGYIIGSNLDKVRGLNSPVLVAQIPGHLIRLGLGSHRQCL